MAPLRPDPHVLLEVDSDGDFSTRNSRSWQGRVVLSLVGVAGLVCIGIAVSPGGAPTSLRTRSAAPDSDGVVGLNVVIKQDGKELNVDQPLPHSESQASVNSDKRCSWGQENCNSTRCCNNPGMKCYQQNSYYAQCRESCSPGPDPTHWDGQSWTCKPLGERSEGSSTCSAPGEDCSKTQCCQEAGTRCFEKAPGWAACKADCWPWAPDLTDTDEHYWSCKKLGGQTPGAADWVARQCSADGEDCRSTKCCKSPGKQCFAQGEDWASCLDTCTPGKDPARSWEPAWSCDKLGMRTPGTAAPPVQTISKWVPEKCSWDGTDCKGSRCCVGMNKQCYAKNKDFAMCMETCQPGRHAEDKNETWSCEALGPRSKGMALKGTPSLFCWSLFQPTSYEMGVIQNQLKKGLGIFQCDGYVTLSTADPTLVGYSPEGDEVKSLHVDMAEITVSVDGTAGNAALFINCWNVIVQDGRWNNFAWTLKVDPDAVLVPDRLRQHLAPHDLENIFILNCNAYPDSPEFPMMYGSLEVLSWRAIKSYADNMWLCMRDMSEFIPLWGEDRFMKKCLDRIGVGAIQDFSIIGDGVCTGVDCGSPYVAAFHPFKSVDGWQACWDQAHR